jgi:hypothetical protein
MMAWIFGRRSSGLLQKGSARTRVGPGRRGNSLTNTPPLIRKYERRELANTADWRTGRAPLLSSGLAARRPLNESTKNPARRDKTKSDADDEHPAALL